MRDWFQWKLISNDTRKKPNFRLFLKHQLVFGLKNENDLFDTHRHEMRIQTNTSSTWHSLVRTSSSFQLSYGNPRRRLASARSFIRARQRRFKDPRARDVQLVAHCVKHFKSINLCSKQTHASVNTSSCARKWFNAHFCMCERIDDYLSPP